MQAVLSLPQPVRFLLAGGLAAGVNWTLRFPFSAVMNFLPAVILATFFGMIVGYVTYRLLVFPRSSRPLLHQMRDFVVVNISSLVVVATVATLFRSVLLLFGTPIGVEPVAHALGIGTGAIFNYLGHSAVTFRNEEAR